MTNTFESTQSTPCRETEFMQRARAMRRLFEEHLEPISCSLMLSQNFQDLSIMAMHCRKHRIASTFRSLSSIFGRVSRTVPEDLPFVFDTAANFLDSLLATPDGLHGVELP